MQLSSEKETISKLGRLIWRDVIKDEASYKKLTENERSLACMYIFEHEMGTDGFYMLFYSIAGAYVNDIHAVCLKIGTVNTAALLIRSHAAISSCCNTTASHPDHIQLYVYPFNHTQLIRNFLR